MRLRAVTSALSARLRTDALTMNMTSGRSESSGAAAANGPPPANAPQAAKHDRMRAVVAVSRRSQRSAAHSSGKAARKAKALR